MDVVILNRRGPEANLPPLRVGQFYFATDTKVLYIGSSTGNVAIANLSDVTDVESALTALINQKSDITHTHGWMKNDGGVDTSLFPMSASTFMMAAFSNNGQIFAPKTLDASNSANFSVPLNASSNNNFVSEASLFYKTRWIGINVHNNIAANTFTSSTVSNQLLGTQFELTVYEGTNATTTGTTGGNPIIAQFQTTRGVNQSTLNPNANFVGTSTTNVKRYKLPIWNSATSAFQLLEIDLYVSSVTLFFRWNSTPSLSLSFVVRWY